MTTSIIIPGSTGFSSSGAPGTVTSVGLTMPSIFSVAGSPVTTSGTLAVTLTTETANFVFSGPTTGAAATPTFRALVTADLPAGTGTVTSVAMTVPAIFSVAGSPVTTSGTLALSLATEAANLIFAGPTTGIAATPTFRALVTADLPAGVGDVVGPASALDNSIVIFSGVTGKLIKDASAVFISSGKLGVGIATPTNDLSFANDAVKKIWIENTATDVVGRDLTVAAGGTVAGTSVADRNGGSNIIQAGLGTGTGTSSIVFQNGTTLTTGNTLQTMSTKMTLLGSGNLGVGTASPLVRLHVATTTANANANFIVQNLQAAAANIGSTIGFYGVSSNDMGDIRCAWEGAATTDAYFNIFLKGSGSVTERLRIASTGRVAIGTNTTTINSTFQVGAISASTIGQIIKLAATPSANAFEVNSSAGTGGDLFGISAAGLISGYMGIATAGSGVPVVRAAARSTAQTAAVASVATYTVSTADASFEVCANVNVTTSTTHNFTVTCAYTDETNAAQTLTLTFSQLAGVLVTAITNITGAGPYSGVPMQIRCKASTAITIATTGTFTSITYNVEGVIKRVA